MVSGAQEQAGGDLRLFNIQRAFHKFDADGSGELDREEFEKAMFFLGLRLSSKELHALFQVADADGSGNIDLDEFASMVKRLLKIQGDPAFANSDEYGDLTASRITSQLTSGALNIDGFRQLIFGGIGRLRSWHSNLASTFVVTTCPCFSTAHALLPFHAVPTCIHRRKVCNTVPLTAVLAETGAAGGRMDAAPNLEHPGVTENAHAYMLPAPQRA